MTASEASSLRPIPTPASLGKFAKTGIARRASINDEHAYIAILRTPAEHVVIAKLVCQQAGKSFSKILLKLAIYKSNSTVVPGELFPRLIK